MSKITITFEEYRDLTRKSMALDLIYRMAQKEKAYVNKEIVTDAYMASCGVLNLDFENEEGEAC